jgi:hypothetical protein
MIVEEGGLEISDEPKKFVKRTGRALLLRNCIFPVGLFSIH